LKPANSLKWHKEVLDWLARWKNSPAPFTKDNSLTIQETAASGVVINIEQVVNGIRSVLTGPKLELQE
jgi:hypothetical protein